MLNVPALRIDVLDLIHWERYIEVLDAEDNTTSVPWRSADCISTPRRHLTAISLFSGGGGLDIGFHQAGYETLACIEFDENACATLSHNKERYFPKAEIINDDVDKVCLDQLMARHGIVPGELDLLYGGPPCQTFSQIGKKGSLTDQRGRLLFSMVNYAAKLQPKAVIIENVKALRTAACLDGESGGVLRQLERALEALGYLVTSQVINAADYGVAQLRQRLFIVAVKGKERFSFPNPTNVRENYTTVGDVLKGLPAPVGKNEKPNKANHVDVTPAGDIRRISFVTEGSFLAKMEHAPADAKGRLTKKDTTKFLRLGRKKQSNTLRCGEVFFHPLEDRYLTPREYMRLHGFPDDYELVGPIRGRSGSVKSLDQHRLVANSVPPPVAKAIAEAIAVKLKG